MVMLLSSRIGSATIVHVNCTNSPVPVNVYPLFVKHSISLKTFCHTNLNSQIKLSRTAVKLTHTTNPILDNASDVSIRQSRTSADWKAARAYKESGFIYEGRIQGFNGGGLLVRFFSLVGFLPFPQLSPSHSCKGLYKWQSHAWLNDWILSTSIRHHDEPRRTIHEIAKGLTGSLISVKVIEADEEKKKLIFSEKEAVWKKYSERVNVEDVFAGRVGSVEDYGAFIHLRFPDGLYHLTGLVHVSEVSWDLIQDIRDFLNEGDEVKVKVIKIDREKSRITLSIKQLEEDPLLETLDKVIPQDGLPISDSLSTSSSSTIEPLPGLEAIFKELLREDGYGFIIAPIRNISRYLEDLIENIVDVRITRQGFEKRVVSQDLQLWLSNAPPIERKFTLLARAGRQVQEIQLTTLLDQEGIKKALQQVLERVP